MIHEDSFNILSEYGSHHDLCNGIKKDDILRFEAENGIILPTELKELYRFFDGGEIFVPGIVIYGICNSKKRLTVREANSKEQRKLFNIPNYYLIIARLNFGDLICASLNEPFDVIQWDHESDCQYCSWTSIGEWLKESVDAFIGFEAGAL